VYESGFIRLVRQQTVRQMLLVQILGLFFRAEAQVNSWVKPASGDWQEPQWSLGILPGTGQVVMVTNQNWKAVAIGPVTTRDFPESLTVQSLTVASPGDSRNLLLMNYAGLQTPLTTRFLTVASNSTIDDVVFGAASERGRWRRAVDRW
jgi:hypothetical protein